jgi:protein SCO1/2
MADSNKSLNAFRRQWLLLVALGIVVVVLVGVVIATVITTNGNKPAPAEHTAAPAPQAAAKANPDIDMGSSAEDVPAPNFVLRDQRGRQTSLAQFRGKVVVLAFIDSHCTTICPLTTESMVEALRLLGPAASQVQLLGINANPLATGVADVAAYTRAHGMQGRWRFLTGALAQLKRVWSGYHVYVAAIHNDIDHDPIFFLIGPDGHERRIFTTQMSYEGVDQQAQVLAQAVARLLPGHPAVRRETSLQYLPPVKPAQTVQLSAIGSHGQTVTVGGAHPHLLLFFAGWLQEGASLQQKLAVLNRYAAAARRHGWPSSVAIDELPSEASRKVAHQLLTHLAATLHAPVVEDKQGRLADGYAVQDLPWFVLTARSGRILWHHDGWLSPAALSRQVRAMLAAK